MFQMSKDSKMWLIFTVYVMVILPWPATIADFIVRIFYPDIDFYLITLFWYSVVPVYLFALGFFGGSQEKQKCFVPLVSYVIYFMGICLWGIGSGLIFWWGHAPYAMAMLWNLMLVIFAMPFGFMTGDFVSSQKKKLEMEGKFDIKKIASRELLIWTVIAAILFVVVPQTMNVTMHADEVFDKLREIHAVALMVIGIVSGIRFKKLARLPLIACIMHLIEVCLSYGLLLMEGYFAATAQGWYSEKCLFCGVLLVDGYHTSSSMAVVFMAFFMTFQFFGMMISFVISFVITESIVALAGKIKEKRLNRKNSEEI